LLCVLPYKDLTPLALSFSILLSATETLRYTNFSRAAISKKALRLYHFLKELSAVWEAVRFESGLEAMFLTKQRLNRDPEKFPTTQLFLIGKSPLFYIYDR
jgi:hypothetical protein